jgi:plasmid replication initiation protein
MQKELFETNTPETFGVTPRYALQHNVVSRSAHELSSTASKLTAMAMSLLPPDLSSLTATFTFAEFCKALGITRGGESYKIFKAAVDECMECVITVETEPDENGKKAWKKFTWFTVATFDEETDQATMKFSDELADFLMALKWMYSKINLKDIGELQSRYAIRLFEMAMSYRSLAGKNGNRDKAWYFERGFPDEIRYIMGIGEEAYKDNHVFKQKVIENPINEINKAGLGLAIKPTTVKQGRQIVAIRFECTSASRSAKRRKRGIKEVIALPELAPNAETQREEKELEHLRELYPDEFAELYEAELSRAPSYLHNGFKQIAAEGSALMQLRERHGIVK